MKKIFILFFYFNILNCNYEEIDEILQMEKDYEEKYHQSLKDYMHQYLKEKKFINNDKLINQEELKQIIFDIILMDYNRDEMDMEAMNLYYEISRILAKKYIKRYKEIKAYDLIHIIKVEEISEIYHKISGEIPFYDEEFDDIKNDL